MKLNLLNNLLSIISCSNIPINAVKNRLNPVITKIVLLVGIISLLLTKIFIDQCPGVALLSIPILNEYVLFSFLHLCGLMYTDVCPLVSYHLP